MGLFHQIGHGLLGNFRALIVQQLFDDGFVFGFDQRITNGFGDAGPHGYRQLVFERAIANDFNQDGVLQHGAAGENGVGDFSGIIGERGDELGGGFGLIREADGEVLAH